MKFPAWAKWVTIVVVLITTLILPLVLFESQSNALTMTVIDWAADSPFTTSFVLVSALAADVFLPVPNGVINTLAGSLFGWVYGAAIIWTGLTLGCITGYGVGRFAGAPIARRFVGEADLTAAHEMAARIGAPALVITRTVPLFAEVATIAAGITQYAFKEFILLTGLANVGVAIVFAGIGNAASEFASGWLAFFGAIALPLMAWLFYRFVLHKRL